MAYVGVGGQGGGVDKSNSLKQPPHHLSDIPASVLWDLAWKKALKFSVNLFDCVCVCVSWVGVGGFCGSPSFLTLQNHFQTTHTFLFLCTPSQLRSVPFSTASSRAVKGAEFSGIMKLPKALAFIQWGKQLSPKGECEDWTKFIIENELSTVSGILQMFNKCCLHSEQPAQ